MATPAEWREFLAPDYTAKDTMHDLSHIDRMLAAAEALSVPYRGQFDEGVVHYAAYAHGVVYQDEARLARWLSESGLPEGFVRRVIRAAWEPQKGSDPETLEGKILHDAHMVEGGKTFLVVKPLVTGSARGQTLMETLEYIERNILGKGRCYLPEAQALYDEMQEYARRFVADLREGLGLVDSGPSAPA